MQKDPLMEFAARPLPPDELSIGVPEQARSVCVPRSSSLMASIYVVASPQAQLSIALHFAKHR